MKSILYTLFGLTLSFGLSAQTFNEVATIFQTNCASSNCHGNGAGGLTFTPDMSTGELYDVLVSSAPNNAWASDRNMPLVSAGHPDNSFLYRKINKDLHEDSALPPAGGSSMPISEELEAHEIELVRQWILFGAREEGTFIDSDILVDFYEGNGLAPVEKPAAPAAGEGFQLHFGRMFLEPDEEKEWIYKRTLENEALEITKIEVVMDSDFSHHFLLFQSPDDINQSPGLIDVGFFGNAQAITSDTKMVGGWAYSRELDLPAGTAYTWEENTTLKFNYHIRNYSTTSVLPADVYINVYTQPVGTAIKEMHSDFYLNTNFPDYNIGAGETKTISHSVPNDNFFSNESFETPPAGEPNEVHLWLFGGHTHQWGTDYDAWLKNPDGTIGEKIYEGFYNIDYEFNQGFYDFEEPAMRLFDPLISFDRNVGIYSEGQYHNQGTSTAQFGLTTEDEMQGFFVQYLVGDISQLPETEEPTTTGINDLVEADLFNVYPNPSNGLVQIQLFDKSETASIRVYNAVGARVRFQTSDNNQLDLSDLANGMYVVEVRQGKEVHKKKIIKQ